MSEDQKYYCPSIEELHPGFAYEYKSLKPEEPHHFHKFTTEWLKAVFTGKGGYDGGSAIHDIQCGIVAVRAPFLTGGADSGGWMEMGRANGIILESGLRWNSWVIREPKPAPRPGFFRYMLNYFKK